MPRETAEFLAEGEYRREWLALIVRDPAVSATAFRLAFSIAHDAGIDGILVARLVLIAGRAGMSTSTASQSIARLAEAGYLKVTRNGPGHQIRVKLSQRQKKPAHFR